MVFKTGKDCKSLRPCCPCPKKHSPYCTVSIPLLMRYYFRYSPFPCITTPPWSREGDVQSPQLFTRRCTQELLTLSCCDLLLLLQLLHLLPGCRCEFRELIALFPSTTSVVVNVRTKSTEEPGVWGWLTLCTLLTDQEDACAVYRYQCEPIANAESEPSESGIRRCRTFPLVRVVR